VAGEHLPPFAPRWWEATLRRCLDEAGVPAGFRLVRAEGARAIAEVEHHAADRARGAWSTVVREPGRSVEIATRRTWGTLRGAKSWLRRRDG
jgi:RNase P/RNase MRP subunit POP5